MIVDYHKFTQVMTSTATAVPGMCVFAGKKSSVTSTDVLMLPPTNLIVMTNHLLLAIGTNNTSFYIKALLLFQLVRRDFDHL